MDLDLDLLATTFEAASRSDPELASSFYRRLTTRHPQVAGFFGGEVTAAQKRMLVEALVAILARLDDPVWLVTTLPRLGRDHVRRGVQPQMYQWFAVSLIESLAEAAGEEWSEDARIQWGAALELVAALMMQSERGDHDV